MSKKQPPWRCSALTRKGRPCGNKAGLAVSTDDRVYCLTHDPARVEERRLRNSKGGRKLKRIHAEDVPPLNTLDDAPGFARWVVQAVAEGRLETRRGDTLLKGLREFSKAYEAAKISARVAELQAQVKQLERERKKGGAS